MLTDVEGNKAFQQNVMNQYGIHPNAEAMIRAHKAAIDPALTHANLIERNDDETAKVREDLAGVAKKLGLKGGTVLDAAVRGHALIALWQPDNGPIRKVVGAYDEKYEPPKLSPAAQMERAEGERERVLAEETARLRAQAELRLAEHRREVDAWLADQMQQIAAAAEKAVEKAVADAQARIAKEKPPPEFPPPAGPILDAPVPADTEPVEVEPPETTSEVEIAAQMIRETTPVPEPRPAGEPQAESTRVRTRTTRSRSSKG
jgi:hypothetical protein